MKFLIRTDASLQIGSGHIMRCLTLANVLREQGHTVKFITREHLGHLADWVHKQGFECVLLPKNPQASFSSSLKHSAWLGCSQAQDFADCEPHIRAFSPDWIICDHYALDAEWQRAAKQYGAKLLVIDDLHDRTHVADVLLDQNLGHTATDYVDWVNENCCILAGTRYALLREEFAAWREKSLARRNTALETAKTHSGSLKSCGKTLSTNVLINLGGVDKDNITLNILQSLAKNDISSLNVTVVMGATAPHINSVRAFSATAPFPCQVLVHVNNMAELMTQADWAIGAAGSTSWERCCLGLPTILLVIADNQREIAMQLQMVGAAFALTTAEMPRLAYLAHETTAKQWHQMSQAAMNICDGLGAKRVAHYVNAFDDLGKIRMASLQDSRLIYSWRNHADIRRFMLNANEIGWADHEKWFAAQFANPNYILLIYEEHQKPLSCLNLKYLYDDVWEWGFYAAPDAPRGTGSKMGRLALAYAFSELGAREVRGQVLPHNVASMRLHEKLGFKKQPENQESDIVAFRLSAEECEW